MNKRHLPRGLKRDFPAPVLQIGGLRRRHANHQGGFLPGPLNDLDEVAGSGAATAFGR
jgi:hypothetical protein